VQEVVALGAHQVHLFVRVIDALADKCRNNTDSANTLAEPVQLLTVKDHATKPLQQKLMQKVILEKTRIQDIQSLNCTTRTELFSKIDLRAVTTITGFSSSALTTSLESIASSSKTILLHHLGPSGI
jgi:hypothetical protein